ncbi:MAG: 8-oxo-dGTP diphosphatase [Chlamydiia bacterium]|nr:8-oxo-dGTP diphosphatase [Chlamydiia bacterium]
MPYCPIIGTLGYILSPDKKKTLLVHRHGRKEDIFEGKYSGLGGKLEPNENVVDGMKREILEEAGLEVDKLSLRGTINWTGFGPHGEDWLGFIFLIESFAGEPYTSNPEGTLEWVDVDQINSKPAWEGDKLFLPLVFDKDPRPFHGYMPYKDSKPQDWVFSRI